MQRHVNCQTNLFSFAFSVTTFCSFLLHLQPPPPTPRPLRVPATTTTFPTPPSPCPELFYPQKAIPQHKSSSPLIQPLTLLHTVVHLDHQFHLADTSLYFFTFPNLHPTPYPAPTPPLALFPPIKIRQTERERERERGGGGIEKKKEEETNRAFLKFRAWTAIEG